MGTLPFPPKRTGHNRHAHLAVEAISNGENGGLILLSHGSNRCFTESSSPCVNKFFCDGKEKKPLHLFWFNGTSAESFGNWERNLTTSTLALWQI